MKQVYFREQRIKKNIVKFHVFIWWWKFVITCDISISKINKKTALWWPASLKIKENSWHKIPKLWWYVTRFPSGRFVPTPKRNGDLIFEIRVYIIWIEISSYTFIYYNMMFIKVSVQELTGISETSHFCCLQQYHQNNFSEMRVSHFTIKMYLFLWPTRLLLVDCHVQKGHLAPSDTDW